MSALDELRFGAQRTLNLRESQPSAAEAVRRADGWLRTHQVTGAKEVLVITGRGSRSPGQLPVLKPAIEKLLFSLRRQGVIVAHAEHNPGAFVVTMAPLRALTEAARRRREPARVVRAFEFEGLDKQTVALLRDLAERSLHALGVTATDIRISDEMHRHVSVLAAGLPSGPEMEEQLRATLRSAINEYD